jgi:spermidine/putrescine transport system substrate-binding protein
MPENAILNMEEIGYVSVIADSTILEWANDENIKETADLRYFFGEGADSVHANQVFYPDKSVIDRCALMHDCGDKTEDMMAMWQRVKGDNLKAWHVWFVAIVVSGVLLFVIIQAVNKKRKRNMQRKKRKHKKN